MVSKNQIKLVTSIQQKKYRIAHQLFLAEGVKVIQELLESNFVLEHLWITKNIFLEIDATKKTVATENDLKKMSALTTPNNCLALFKIPQATEIILEDLIVALDDIRDPGNFGTIIRLCDWFGIQQIWCSKETVDLYNPKVVQASMGSIARVNVSYVNLYDVISKSKLPVYGTFMDGENVYSEKLSAKGILVLGNEANGISKELENIIQNRIAIPRFGTMQQTESLNVATATAIFLSEFKRNSK